jgi:DsbC/DsbD-like thiol-disulfide interchange protein
MRSTNCFASFAVLAFSATAFAQAPGVLTVAEPQKLVVKRGENATSALKLAVKEGYHVNSNTPAEAYLIPLKITWDSAGPLEAVELVYPKPKQEKYEFSEKPLSVFDGEFEVKTTFKRSATAAPGPASLSGKIRYQACNDKMCLPPKTLEIRLPLLLQ